MYADQEGKCWSLQWWSDDSKLCATSSMATHRQTSCMPGTWDQPDWSKGLLILYPLHPRGRWANLCGHCNAGMYLLFHYILLTLHAGLLETTLCTAYHTCLLMLSWSYQGASAWLQGQFISTRHTQPAISSTLLLNILQSKALGYIT